jgi:release factor glutamine methyltransferase
MTTPTPQHFHIHATDIVLQAADGVFMPSPNGLFYAESLRVEAGERVLDIGTGSGLLAILAAKLGAQVTATDTDPRAIAAAEYNAALNHVTIDCCQGSLFADLTGSFDVIIANLPNEIVAPAHLAELAQQDIEVFSGGEHGNTLILALLERAKAHMHATSRLYLPIHSLTKYHQTLAVALQDYQLRLLSFKELPTKAFVAQHIDYYKHLNQTGSVQIFQRDHSWYSYGYVFEAKLLSSPLGEAARNNLPTSLALPFDRLRTSDRLRERSMGKLFPGVP